MLRRSYPEPQAAAIGAQTACCKRINPGVSMKATPSGRRTLSLLIFGLAAMVVLAGCQPKKPTGGLTQPVKSFTRLAPPPKSAAEIQLLMQQAKSGQDIQPVLEEFDRLALEGEPLIRDEAIFRKAQIMLELQLPDAQQTVLDAIEQHPEHALAPYAHFWLAKYWMGLDESERALEEMGKALRHVRLTRELADEMLSLGSSVALDVPERDAINWLMAAAEVDQGGRDSWLRLAARRGSVATIEQLHAEGSIPAELMASFDLHAARKYLMIGDRQALSSIADLMASYVPSSPESEQVRLWASGNFRAATIGVMLPLSGEYGRYGEAALRGIRMALAGMDSGEDITLRIEDTAGENKKAITAYQHLSSAHVDMIIGPLLAESTEALQPYLKSDLPMLSLTGRTDLANESPALFVHTLSPLAQVEFMARYAWQQGAQRVVIVAEDDGNGMLREAGQFKQAFEAIGGEVMQTLLLKPENLDHRNDLRQLRFETDDEELLAELDTDLALLSPEMDVEITMPVHFDAMYLAMEGAHVAVMAGQLAYTGIRDVPIYGSSRWLDGHLLDDRGRYLSRARFAGANATGGTVDATMRKLRFMYREAWGDGQPSELTALAYDTLLIATVMTSRLGLSGRGIIKELHDIEGFPGITGHVHFDGAGVGQKQLDVYGILRGKIAPAG